MLPGFALIDQRRPIPLVDDPTRSARGTTTGRRPPAHCRSADEASAARADEPRQNLDDARETNAAGGLDRQNLPGPLVRDLRHVSVWPWAHQSSTKPVIHTWFGAGRCRPTRSVGGHAQSGHLQFRPLPQVIHPRAPSCWRNRSDPARPQLDDTRSALTARRTPPSARAPGILLALMVWSKRTDPGPFRESDHQINGVVVR
jgi:hypothetical protein